jgi:CDP-2,3-bis-(O-geranylgeranyl)-sn-glycerol synthase
MNEIENTEDDHIMEGIKIEERNKKVAFRLAIIFASLIFAHFIIISILYTSADWIANLIFSLLFIVPGYLSNAGMVIVGGGKPIDGGKNWRDGRRVFGDHKTINGFIKGPLFIGIPLSLGLFFLFMGLWPFIAIIPELGTEMGIYELYNDVTYYKYYFIGGDFPIGILVLILRIVLCSYGAAFGDLIGSFLKRRFNISSGQPFWLVDQLDFALMAILFTSIPSLILPSIFRLANVQVILFLIILTPSVSILSNTIAYLLDLKDVPW